MFQIKAVQTANTYFFKCDLFTLNVLVHFADIQLKWKASHRSLLIILKIDFKPIYLKKVKISAFKAIYIQSLLSASVHFVVIYFKTFSEL